MAFMAVPLNWLQLEPVDCSCRKSELEKHKANGEYKFSIGNKLTIFMVLSRNSNLWYHIPLYCQPETTNPEPWRLPVFDGRRSALDEGEMRTPGVNAILSLTIFPPLERLKQSLENMISSPRVNSFQRRYAPAIWLHVFGTSWVGARSYCLSKYLKKECRDSFILSLNMASLTETHPSPG